MLISLMCHNSNKMLRTTPKPSAFHLCVARHYWHLLLLPGEPWAKFLTSLVSNTDICTMGHYYSLLLQYPSYQILQLQIQEGLSCPHPMHFDMRPLLQLTSRNNPLGAERTPATFLQCSFSSLPASLTWCSLSWGIQSCCSADFLPWEAEAASHFPPTPCSISHHLKRQMATQLDLQSLYPLSCKQQSTQAWLPTLPCSPFFCLGCYSQGLRNSFSPGQEEGRGTM